MSFGWTQLNNGLTWNHKFLTPHSRLQQERTYRWQIFFRLCLDNYRHDNIERQYWRTIVIFEQYEEWVTILIFGQNSRCCKIILGQSCNVVILPIWYQNHPKNNIFALKINIFNSPGFHSFSQLFYNITST